MSHSTIKLHTSLKYCRDMATSISCKDYSNNNIDVGKHLGFCTTLSGSVGDSVPISADEKLFDDLSGCDQELPMDFQQLLESPESTNMSLNDAPFINNKQPSSFIQCGTNIISSIWSEKTGDSMVCDTVGESGKSYISSEKSSWGLSNGVSNNKPELMLDSGSSFNSWGSESMYYRSCPRNIDNKAPSEEFSKLPEIEGRLVLIQDKQFLSSINTTLQSSLITLNHNRIDSSFTEVIPRVTNPGFSIKAEDTINIDHINENKGTVFKKEEDLLTSMKTHFRPIKQDTFEIVPATALTFPDGTTFPISNSLDEPNFLKSPGGGLYLDSDKNKKYMAFNDPEDNSSSQFIPKFLVRQNEKFCQTEEYLLTSQNYSHPSKELFFPKDENHKVNIQLASGMVEEEGDEEGENVFWSGGTCIKVDGWVATWPANGIWSNEANVTKIRCDENVWNNINETVETSNDRGSGVEEGDQYTQLRNEWTQEAEELLSDISQHLYLANYVDNQPAKTSLVESAWNQLSAAPFTRSLPITTSYSLMQS